VARAVAGAIVAVGLPLACRQGPGDHPARVVVAPGGRAELGIGLADLVRLLVVAVLGALAEGVDDGRYVPYPVVLERRRQPREVRLRGLAADGTLDP